MLRGCKSPPIRYAHTQTHTYAYTHMHTYIHTYIHAYMHTYTHAYTHHVYSLRYGAMWGTSCTPGVQENAAIGLIVLQSAEIVGLIICFALHFLWWQLNNTPKPRRQRVRCTTSGFVCTSWAPGYKRMLQSAWSYSWDCRVNHMFSNTFPMRDNWIIPLNIGDQG